jgi:hypothetical protein
MRYSDIAAGRDARENGTPIDKLINTFELCEQVLDYLPMEEVLLATRICRALKTNIENSSRLKAKLFLAPDLTIKKLAVSATGTLLSGVKAERAFEALASTAEQTTGSGTSILLPTAHADHHLNSAEDFDRTDESEGREIALYKPHPWLTAGRLSDRYRRRGMVKYATVCLETRRYASAMYLVFNCQNVLTPLSDTSSLNKMFLCQPPAKEVSVWYPCPSMNMGKTIRNETGVTIGEVIRTTSWIPSLQNVIPRGIEVVLQGGFVANSEARDVAERAGELSPEDDPTRWLYKDGKHVLQEGGFAFA